MNSRGHIGIVYIIANEEREVNSERPSNVHMYIFRRPAAILYAFLCRYIEDFTWSAMFIAHRGKCWHESVSFESSAYQHVSRQSSVHGSYVDIVHSQHGNG